MSGQRYNWASFSSGSCFLPFTCSFFFPATFRRVVSPGLSVGGCIPFARRAADKPFLACFLSPPFFSFVPSELDTLNPAARRPHKPQKWLRALQNVTLKIWPKPLTRRPAVCWLAAVNTAVSFVKAPDSVAFSPSEQEAGQETQRCHRNHPAGDDSHGQRHGSQLCRPEHPARGGPHGCDLHGLAQLQQQMWVYSFVLFYPKHLCAFCFFLLSLVHWNLG